MKFLHIIRTTDPATGGPVESVLRTSEVLAREGHEVEIVSLEPAQASRCATSFPVHALGSGMGRYGYNSRLGTWLLQHAAEFEAIFLHGLWNYTSAGSWRALRRLGVPYFVYVHGMLDPWFRQRYPLKHVAKQLLWSLAEGRVLRDAEAVFFTSEEEKVCARHVFHGYRYNERVVLYGTADPCGSPPVQRAVLLDAFPGLQGRRLLLFLSRIDPKKGCNFLLCAFARALPRLPMDLDLVIAGPDRVDMVPGLKALSRRLGIAHRVHWPGMLSGDAKWGALRGAEALVLPSHQENFGIVVAEAMACATPVLISDKVNIAHEVKRAGAGLVAPDTEQGTFHLISSFFALSEQERALMKMAARQAFLRNFEIGAVARDLLCAVRQNLVSSVPECRGCRGG